MAVLLFPVLLDARRVKTVGRVAAAGGVTKESLTPVAVLASPVVLLKRASRPVAVLPSPVVSW